MLHIKAIKRVKAAQMDISKSIQLELADRKVAFENRRILRYLRIAEG